MPWFQPCRPPLKLKKIQRWALLAPNMSPKCLQDLPRPLPDLESEPTNLQNMPPRSHKLLKMRASDALAEDGKKRVPGRVFCRLPLACSPILSILNPQSSILNPQTSILSPQSSILNPQSSDFTLSNINIQKTTTQ